VHDYLFPSEVVRFAFVFGVVVAMLLYERRHLTVGSIVVPGYIAIFIVAPMVLFITFLNAGITYLLMNKLIRRRFLLYGRSKFTVMALISIAMQSVLLRVTPAGPWLWESDFPLFVGAGYVVPALIAHDMGRQGVQRTIKAVMLAGAIVATPARCRSRAPGCRSPCCSRPPRRGQSRPTTGSSRAASSAPPTSACSWATHTRWP
jgi:poly-gamma-glutamate biosynthesis protein PgsC/CapC